MKAPYGYYLNENGEVVIDNKEATVVTMIFDMYIAGVSLRKISQKLSEEGYNSPSGKSTWSAQTIDNIIGNSKYIAIVSIEKYFEACFVKDRR